MVEVQLSLLSHCFTVPLQVILGRFLWEDPHHRAREGGEQKDAMMPLLFFLDQHSALAAVQAQMVDGEVLLASHDDICSNDFCPRGFSPTLFHNCVFPREPSSSV